jgi:hypothetical protein
MAGGNKRSDVGSVFAGPRHRVMVSPSQKRLPVRPRKSRVELKEIHGQRTEPPTDGGTD